MAPWLTKLTDVCKELESHLLVAIGEEDHELAYIAPSLVDWHLLHVGRTYSYL